MNTSANQSASANDTAGAASENISAKKGIPLRFVTAASLFDGHDAAINIMRRILQGAGVEVIHLAHNRSVAEVVQTALQEDAQGIAISSYQGGHVEYFKYAVDLLKEAGAEHIKIFGGGGGVIDSDVGVGAATRDLELGATPAPAGSVLMDNAGTGTRPRSRGRHWQRPSRTAAAVRWRRSVCRATTNGAEPDRHSRQHAGGAGSAAESSGARGGI